MVKKVEYLIEQAWEENGKSGYSLCGSYSDKKETFGHYRHLCEVWPKYQFKITKRTTTEEKIAESEDVRQARFDFAK